MVTALRLARFGCRNRPFYRFVAIDSRKPRDAKPIEYLGTYNPIPHGQDGVKEVRMQVDRIKYWLSVGAQPSDRVAYLLWRAGMMPAPPLHYAPTVSIPKETRRAAEKARKGFHTWSTAAAVAGGLGGDTAPRSIAYTPAHRLSTFSGGFVRPSPLPALR